MPKKKKKRIEPLSLLRPMVLPAELEPELRKLYQLACKNSQPVWSKFQSNGDKPPSQDIINEFMKLTHGGMRQAQTLILQRLLETSAPERVGEVRTYAYRGISDAIGWQLFKNELAYVKRFFMAQRPPNLERSNIESVIWATEQAHQQHPDSIALLSDLTSFIQVGDIYHAKADGSIGIYEVKEGKTNRKILDILENTPALVNPESIPDLFDDKSESFQKQVQRTLRQKQRMNALKETLGNDEGVDAQTGLKVKIHTLPAWVGTWFNTAVHLGEACEPKGYAIDVIQDCLFIGCYKTGKFKVPGQLAFEGWFKAEGGTDGCPRTSLINCMQDPLGLTIYNLPLPDALKFDLLFGRKHIAMAIHMQRLLEICNEKGMKVRFGNRKETARLKQRNKHLWVYNGQAIIFERNGQQMCLGEGFALRVFYHGENPVDALRAITMTE
ncbi:hypothetical protein WE348_08915 [Alteromonas macleodii]|uniref:hypothetical protein n=1 Tax=Alteromonas macleodii TaxID=28108 RepID=UPI000C972A46|nr:hypothetical protein [Idiomarinaceae bacterium]